MEGHGRRFFPDDGPPRFMDPTFVVCTADSKNVLLFIVGRTRGGVTRTIYGRDGFSRTRDTNVYHPLPAARQPDAQPCIDEPHPRSGPLQVWRGRKRERGEPSSEIRAATGVDDQLRIRRLVERSRQRSLTRVTD